LVFGLGLNVNSPASAWPTDLARHAVSLAEVAGAPLDLNRLTAALIGRVLLAYERFVEGDHVKTFADLWHRYDVLRGKSITLLEGGRRHPGNVTGLDDDGALLLRDSRGRTQRFRAGEVTIEKAS
jgi:BirA family biotin operon repressor/biotin-[acetyl-CoA-carboxylase] ligase